MIDLYAEYIKEREGLQIYKTEHGFMSYLISGKECYIKDAFIRKEHRSVKNIKHLGDAVSDIARTQGCKILTTGIDLTAPNATEILQMNLRYGFSLMGSTDGYITLKKDL